MTSTRRAFLHGGLGALLARNTLAAGTDQLAVPQVDSVSLRILVDNATFGPFLPSLVLPGLQVRRSNPDAGAAVMTRTPLQAEFGLSLLAESKLGPALRRVLVDFGYSPEVLANNLRVLGIDVSQIDAAVLSHGHLDHYGGYPGLFRAKGVPNQRLPLYAGGEETFCERIALIGTPPPVMGTLDRRELVRAGYDVRIAAEPVLVAGHAFTTGLIPLAGFERAAIPTQMRPGVGCDPAQLSPAKRNAKQLPDDGEHELATAYHVKDLGLVVIASCSHRGVLNSIRRAQEVSGITRVHAVMGGFHLVRPRTDEEARRTVAELAQFNPRYIVPMHCTGEVFIAEALRLMPDKVIRPYVGDLFTFGAAT